MIEHDATIGALLQQVEHALEPSGDREADCSVGTERQFATQLPGFVLGDVNDADLGCQAQSLLTLCDGHQTKPT